MICVSPLELSLIQSILKKHAPDCEARAFGSRYKWTANDYSDLDIALAGKEKLALKKLCAVKDAFEESPLPFRVDVLDWNAVSAEFREIISNGYEVIYAPEKQKTAWPIVRLGDVCDITSSKRIFANEYQEIGIPFYRGKEIIEKQKGKSISTKLFIDNEKYNEILKKHGVPVCGDILLTSVGTLGVPYVVKNESFYFKDGNLTWFRNFKNADNKFLYYWLLSPYCQNQINAKCIGSTQKALTIETLLQFTITLPPLPTQQAIAATLSCLDDKIELNNRINANLEAQAQAIFKSWFVDFEPFQGGEFVDSELGRIPKGWRVGKLGEIANITSGNRPLNKVSDKTKVYSIPIIGASSIMGYTKNILYDARILVIGRVGTHGIVQRLWSKCWPSDNTLIITSDYYEFVYQVLRTINYKNINRGTTQPLITQTDMKNISIITPHKSNILQFECVIDTLFKVITHNTLETRTLAAIRDTLLPRLMSGEIKIKEENL